MTLETQIEKGQYNRHAKKEGRKFMGLNPIQRTTGN